MSHVFETRSQCDVANINNTLNSATSEWWNNINFAVFHWMIYIMRSFVILCRLLAWQQHSNNSHQCSILDAYRMSRWNGSVFFSLVSLNVLPSTEITTGCEEEASISINIIYSVRTPKMIMALF